MNDAAEIDRVKEMFADFPDLKVDCENKDQNTPLHFLCKYITSPQCTEIGTSFSSLRLTKKLNL